MAIKLPDPVELSVGESETVSIDLTRHLDATELLTSAPQVSEVRTSTLAPNNATTNASSYVDRITGKTVAIGKAIQFTLSPTKKGSFIIRFTVSTNATPVRTVVRDVDVEIE